jgi:hypothetical protein
MASGEVRYFWVTPSQALPPTCAVLPFGCDRQGDEEEGTESDPEIWPVGKLGHRRVSQTLPPTCAVLPFGCDRQGEEEEGTESDPEIWLVGKLGSWITRCFRLPSHLCSPPFWL